MNQKQTLVEGTSCSPPGDALARNHLAHLRLVHVNLKEEKKVTIFLSFCLSKC